MVIRQLFIFLGILLWSVSSSDANAQTKSVKIDKYEQQFITCQLRAQENLKIINRYLQQDYSEKNFPSYDLLKEFSEMSYTDFKKKYPMRRKKQKKFFAKFENEMSLNESLIDALETIERNKNNQKPD